MRGDSIGSSAGPIMISGQASVVLRVVGACVVSIIASLLGCSSAPLVSHPGLELTVPEQWTSAFTTAIEVEGGWVRSFNDPELEAIVTGQT